MPRRELMPRRDLPPPPPSADLRAWLDEAVVRADRARSLQDLGRRSLGLGRLLLLWGVAALFAVGWTFLGMALRAVESADALSYLYGVIFLGLATGVLIPAGLWFVRGARQDRQVRQLLCAWAESDRDPATDARLRAPGRSLAWLLASLAVGVSGLYLTFGAALSGPPQQATYGGTIQWMGLGLILWTTGLLGLGKAGAHYRWAVRALRGGPTAR